MIDLTRLISFESRRIIDENACKEFLILMPAKKIPQRAQNESYADFKTKHCVFATSLMICVNQHACTQYIAVIKT